MIDGFSLQFYTIIYLVIAASLFLCAFFVWRRDVARVSNQFILVSAFFASMWILMTAAQINELDIIQIEYARIIIPHVFAGVAVLLFTFFSFTFAKKRSSISTRHVPQLFAPLGVVLLASVVFPDQFIVESAAKDTNYGWVYALFVCTVGVYSFISLWTLRMRYLSSAGVFRSVVRGIVIIFASALALVFVLGLIHAVTHIEAIRVVLFVVILLAYLLISLQLVRFYRWRIKPYVAELFVSFIALVLFSQILLSDDYVDVALNISIFIIFVIAGYFLVKNITHEARLQDEIELLVKDLKEVNDQLQMLDRRKSEFVKISAHHLKSPLTAIKGYASMILEGSFGDLRPEAREAIQKIFSASERLVGIINDFMDISNIESGKMEYVFETTDLKKLVEGVLEEMKLTIEKSGLKVTFNTDEISGYDVRADANKLRQVISNLTDNAIKYTPKGTVHLFLKKEKHTKKIHLTITDTGIGMSKETIENLFEKFSRAHDANKVNTGGSGLGLYVAKEIMKKHNARIWVESPGEGRGSTFHLVFDMSL